MKSKDALRVLAEVTASQWGMVTSAQASMYGITRLDLSRLAADGQLQRVAHGVYKDAGAPAGPHDDLQAAWLSTDPRTMGEARIKDAPSGVVVAGESAADLHGIGDFRALRHDFVSPARRQSQRSTIRYRQRTLEPRDVMLVEGLPVMTMERTIVDLVEDLSDLSLVADALRDAWGKRTLDLQRLRKLLAPLAARDGFGKGDGEAFLNRLMEIAGIDIGSLAQRVAGEASLGALVTADFVGRLRKDDLELILMTPKMEEAVLSIQASFAEALERALRPQLEGINAASKQALAAGAKPVLDEAARTVAEQLVSGDAMKEFTKSWAESLSDNLALKPETLALARAALRTADSA